MANQWLRLWHDMPNDPKWRTVARLSGRPISLVLSVYLHLLVDASRNVTRGHVDVTSEDLASALDVTEKDIAAVLDAMQGRVIDGGRLSGWESRQPKREDSGDPESGAKSAAERKREQRMRDKSAVGTTKSPDGHAESRNVTPDKDKDKEKKDEPATAGSCAEQGSTPAGPPPVAMLPLVDGSDHPIAQAQAEEWGSAYPALDIESELLRMRAWLIANPRNRKTRRGVNAFVVTWLSRSQDKAARQPARSAGKQTTSDRRADWNQRLNETIAANTRQPMKDMGTIDATHNS